MLDSHLETRLKKVVDLPSIPAMASRLLKALDNPNIRASVLAELIERDQTLTSKVLQAANSAYYGMAGKISTVDLAVVIMGLNSIKEIVIGMILQKLFSKVNSYYFDVNNFWKYSIFCGSTSRLLARKLKYRLAGEAFVAGLMHDIGILILVHFFEKEFNDIKTLHNSGKFSWLKAEELVLNCGHGDIGAWVAEQWALPKQLCDSIRNHHSDINTIEVSQAELKSYRHLTKSGIKQPLTAIVSMSEWFALEMGFKSWLSEYSQPKLFMSGDFLMDINDQNTIEKHSAFHLLKREIAEEFERSSSIASTSSKSLYN